MSEIASLPREILPHGPGLQLLGERVASGDEWLAYTVALTAEMSACNAGGHFEPEVGLEIMAQACGMLLATQGTLTTKTVGVVASVRGYEYSLEPFAVGAKLLVRVKPEAVDDELAVCEGELLEQGCEEPIQRARITLVLRGDGV